MENLILNSPFEPVLGSEEIELPEVFQKQFLSAVDGNPEIILEGRMDKVWHRPAWLRPIFWSIGI